MDLLLNRNHQAFDEAMEVLCMLSEWPNVRFVDDLCTDLGYTRRDEVEEHLRNLKARGFLVDLGLVKVEGPDGRRGRAAWIEPTGTGKATEAAGAYFDEVYA